MKIVITERQHNLLIEQQSYNLTGPGSYYGTYGYDASGKTEFSKINPHTLMTIAQIGTAFIPMIGPFVSAGIGLADAAMYYKEGDKKTAGIVAAFSIIPGIGGLASKLGLTKWTSKALGEIGKKISLGSKLTPAEIEVVEKVAQNEKLIKSEVDAVRKNITNRGKETSGNIITKFEDRFFLGECFSNSNCPAIREIISGFYSKIANTARWTKFYPSEVKVLSRANVAGREVVETQLKDGSKVLFYKSSGANVATTGKEAGEWFVIPGFARNGWFFKTSETVNLTKGGNKYLTDMAEFLKYNGSQMLGK